MSELSPLMTGDNKKGSKSVTYGGSNDLEQGGHGHSHASGGHGHSHSHSHSHSHGTALSPRSAYKQRDVEASKRAHDAKRKKAHGEDGAVESSSESGHAGDAGEYMSEQHNRAELSRTINGPNNIGLLTTIMAFFHFS